MTLPPLPYAERVAVNLVDMDAATRERPPTPVKIPGPSEAMGLPTVDAPRSLRRRADAWMAHVTGPCHPDPRGLASSDPRYMLAQAKVFPNRSLTGVGRRRGRGVRAVSAWSQPEGTPTTPDPFMAAAEPLVRQSPASRTSRGGWPKGRVGSRR